MNSLPDDNQAGQPSAQRAARLRQLPAIHQLVAAPQLNGWAHLPRQRIVQAARRILDQCRQQLLGRGTDDRAPAWTLEELAQRVASVLHKAQDRRIRPLVNATGIILHTGLGRAPLSAEAVQAIQSVAAGYANVEIDLTTGRRGRRGAGVKEQLCSLTGAEAATVVNNNAAATLLALATLANQAREGGAQVIVSRGELIEIGGSFRLPQIMQVSNATLREVGTTNKTRLSDYEQAIDVETVALMKVHTSNYRVVGFTEAVAIGPLVALGARHRLAVVHDVGSGALVRFDRFGLEQEPTVTESIQAGADLVLFSADKLLGGPQAGLILGRRHWIDQLESNPLYRALRVDKLTLAALEAILHGYDDLDRAWHEIPVLGMVATTVEQLEARADKLAARFQQVGVAARVLIQPTTAYLGGGSLPQQGLPSVAVRLDPESISEAQLAHRLRLGEPAVIGRIREGAVWLDLRTVFARQDAAMGNAVIAALDPSQDGRGDNQMPDADAGPGQSKV